MYVPQRALSWIVTISYLLSRGIGLKVSVFPKFLLPAALAAIGVQSPFSSVAFQANP